MQTAVAVTRDLLFSTKISGTGQALGIGVQVTGSADVVQKALSSGEVRLVIVDMALPQDVACACIQAASAHPSSPEILAFYSHVDAAARDAAQSAGAQQVMPRSKFSAELPDILRIHCAE